MNLCICVNPSPSYSCLNRELCIKLIKSCRQVDTGFKRNACPYHQVDSFWTWVWFLTKAMENLYDDDDIDDDDDDVVDVPL